MNELRLIDRDLQRPTTPARGRSGSRRLRLPALDPVTRGADLRALAGGTVAVFLMIFWAVDDGGFDPGVWYWGGLVALAALAGLLAVTRGAFAAMGRPLTVALGLFAAYVAFSYLSMTWAAYPGLALQGSNRALVYLILFALMAALPWRAQTALLVLGAFAAGIGVIAIALLFRFALGDNVPGLFLAGRLVSPTGYINSTAALFTIGGLVAVALAARRQLPGPARGLLVAFAAADLMLAVTVQSRGWLFTLPLVGLYAIVVAAGRLRAVAAAILPAAGTLAVIHPMLHLFQIAQPAALTHAAVHAGKVGLLSCAAVFGLGTLAAWIEAARSRPALGAAPRRALGTLAVLLAIAGLAGGLVVVSSGHPGSFVSDQWHGFTREPSASDSATHFGQVGSGRYDFWRASLEAFKAHPVGGLGQDNFGDYYLTHRRTSEEPLWTHSLELRLLAHTGAIGFLLFAGLIAAALGAAFAARRRGSLEERMLVGAALLPLGVWLIHGSIDWFWEVPALSAPALGFLAMAGRLRAAPYAERSTVADGGSGTRPVAPVRRRRIARPVSVGAGLIALAAATVVLGLPYLAVRELNMGETASHTNVTASLADFRSSHQLNPLMSDPGILGGTVALINGRDFEAAGLFRQGLAREPGQWFGWLGRGLAASAQGQVDEARRSFAVADRLNSRQLAVRNALKQIGTRHPLTIDQALDEIDYLP